MRTREPINIAPKVREELRDLLCSPTFEATGVGYSAFIATAIERCMADDPEAFLLHAQANRRRVAQLDREREDTCSCGLKNPGPEHRAWFPMLCREDEASPFDCDFCGDGDALLPDQSCAYCGFDPEQDEDESREENR